MLALCVSARAQVVGPGEPPPRGLFGGGRGVNTAKTLLDLSASLVEGYDIDEARGVVSTPLPTATQPPASQPATLYGGGFSTLFRGGATYARRGKAEVGANASSVLRYYSDPGIIQSVGHNAGVGLTTETVGGLKLVANQSAAYSPASAYGLFPGSSALQPGNPGLAAPNYTVSNFQSYAYTTAMLLGHGIGRRNNVSVSGEYIYTDRVHATQEWGDVSSYSLSSAFSRNTTRHTVLSTDLRYRSGQFTYRGGGTTTELALDVGVNYARPLSATRVMTVDVHTGVSRGNYPLNVIGLTGSQLRYRVVGDGVFNMPLSQTWVASASFQRGLEYETSFATPIVNNGAKAAVTGSLTSRVDVAFSGGYARAESILNSATLSIDAYTSEVNVRYALTRTFALTGAYLYYYYMADDGTLLLPGMPPGLRRNGVRVGFTVWTPALRR